MTTKYCKKCDTEKEPSCFTKDKHCSDGLNAYCKDCRLAASRRLRGVQPERYFANQKSGATKAEITKAWRLANPQAYKDSIARRNPEQGRAANRTWRAKNVVQERARSNAWRKLNPEVSARSGAIRRAAERRACPAWADRSEMRDWYRLAEVMSRGGVKFTVDHIVPLRSKLVCGLHAPANFQLMTALENSSKSNRFWPDMA